MPSFPTPIWFRRQMYFDRDQVEAYKAALLNRPPPPPRDLAELVDAKTLGRELNLSRRSIGRRFRDAMVGGPPPNDAPIRPCDFKHPVAATA